MNESPIISIVVPVWNGEKYLNLALDSIVRQTFNNIEIIIVNDCSTDNSSKIIKTYVLKNKRIRVVNNEKNLKLPSSLNRGFDIAQGKYFTWTSDDNIMHPDFIEVMLGELERKKADIVYSDFNVIDEKGMFSGVSYIGESEALVCYNVIGASFLYKKEVHERIKGYDPNCFLWEDYDFWVRAYLAGFHFVKSHKIVYDYRQHAKSLTNSCKVSDVFAFYRYNLRKRFNGVKKNVAFEARSLLMGYRPVLGLRRWFILLGEATILNPIGACLIILRLIRKMPYKIKELFLAKST